jgi:Escherichia/Staphylococcus phage prohead protease
MDRSPERRFQALETRATTDGISGLAAVFDSWSCDLGGFIEIVRPGAFDQILKRGPNVPALLNHNPHEELSRTRRGTLRLWADDRGLRYESALPDNDLGVYVTGLLAKRALAGSSFSFTVDPNGGDRWEHDTFPKRREILRVDGLFDVSPVWSPAYPETTVELIPQPLEARDRALRLQRQWWLRARHPYLALVG